MKRTTFSAILIIGAGVAVLGGRAISAQEKYTLQVPGGLAFADFRGYESWPVIAISENGGNIAVIMGNSVMIDAFKEGVPGNGKPFPDSARMAKVHWIQKNRRPTPVNQRCRGPEHDVDFMVKDSQKFADSGGWGYAEFEYDAASDTFRLGTLDDEPPQANDAKCGFAATR